METVKLYYENAFLQDFTAVVESCGPSGEVWKLEDNLYPFVELCSRVLSDKPLFVVLNSYTTGLAPSVLGYILQMLVGRKFGGTVTWDELGLPCTESGMALPCGATGRWFSE